MPSSPRIIRVVVGLLLGGVLGLVLAGSTNFRWNGPPLTASLGDSYCCDPSGPTCTPMQAGTVCNGGAFPTLGSCQTSCSKPIYCCDKLQGTGQVCQQGFKNIMTSTCQNPAVTFTTLGDCTTACPFNGSGAILSISSSSSASDTPYCGCNTGEPVCIPATAS